MNYLFALISTITALLLSIFYRNSFSTMSATTTTKKLPVYFTSVGGPSFMYENDQFGNKGAFKTLKSLGQKIENEIKPDFIIIVSAHWLSSLPDLVEIDYPSKTPSSSTLVGEDENELIYDFYGFPPSYYKETFHSKGSKPIAEKIAKTLSESGFKTKLTTRGLDHGTWVGFKVAFTDQQSNDSHKWDVSCPVIQVSLTASADHDIHYKLGKALSSFREQNGLIIGSGMSVHNLLAFRLARAAGTPLENVEMPFTPKFNSLLTDIVTSTTGDKRLAAFNTLNTEHKDLYQNAHPTNEHFLPVVVAAGAAENETGKELYNAASGSLGWGYYEFNG